MSRLDINKLRTLEGITNEIEKDVIELGGSRYNVLIINAKVKAAYYLGQRDGGIEVIERLKKRVI